MTEDSGEWCRDDPTPLEGTNRIMMMMMMYIVGFIDAKIQSLYHILQTFMSGSYIGNIPTFYTSSCISMPSTQHTMFIT